jgi:dephospho-CoA kinase
MHIAITGGIGSGKSYVCRQLQERGISVYDCDAAAKRLMHTSPILRQQLTELIGPDTYVAPPPPSVQLPQSPQLPQPPQQPSPTPILNKAAVARFLLQSAHNAQAINDIVHPAVAADFLQSGMQWLESAILFQSAFDRRVHFDAIVCVTAPDDVRISRIMVRDSISREKAQQWLSSQWPQHEVLQRSDYEIINDGKRPLPPQIEQLLHKLHI